MTPGSSGRYRRRNSANGRSPMKQMPVLSFFSAMASPAARASSSHLALQEAAERHQHVDEIGGGDGVQEIALVLGGIDALAQLRHAADGVDARVMARRDVRRAEALRVAAHDAELDLPVAEHVGIRRAALAVLGEEVGEHLLAILAREVDAVQRQAELEADAARILKLARIVAIAVVLPVAHVQALDGMARVAQQQGGDGGIDAAREGDDGQGARGHAGILTGSSVKAQPKARSSSSAARGSR